MTQYALYLVLAVVSVAAGVVMFSTAARRLLGIRVGPVRTVLTGAVGLSGWWLFGITVPSEGRPIMVAPVQLGVALLAAMAFLALSEVVWPSPFRPWGLARSLRRRLGRGQRYAEISRIAVRHGLLSRRHPGVGGTSGGPSARSLRLALEEAGVTFVKLGQVLSLRRDLLPADVAAELACLQHEARPASWVEVEQVLREELGANPQEVFAHVDPEPLAAASVGQVHRARLLTGQQVVLKIQRPGIRRVVLRDLDIARRLAGQLELRTAWGTSLGAGALADGFSTALLEELDFRVEARNVAAVASSMKEGPLRVPSVHQAMCTERLLVLDYLDGVPLASADAPLPTESVERRALARLLLHSMLDQMLHRGIFHADPHPGNVLVLADGGLGLLDFGSVGRLDLQMRSALIHVLYALGRGHAGQLHDALLEVLVHAEQVEGKDLERALGQFMARHLGPGSRLSTELFTDLVRLLNAHGLGVPPEVAAVFRALATLEGTLERLSPGIDLVHESTTFALTHVTDRLRPSEVARTFADEALELMPMLRRLPRRVERILGSVEQGNLNVNVRLFSDPGDRRFIASLLHQVMLGFLGAATGVGAIMLLGTAGGPAVTPTLGLYAIFGYNLLLLSAVLVLRVLFLSFRTSDREGKPAT